MPQVEIHKSGPIFDGTLISTIKKYNDAVAEDVADEGLRMVQQRLGTVLRHPTGHYQRSIHLTTQSGQDVVSDGGVIYGPWLEGVGSRNHRSRFKGYATFRKVRQELGERAGDLASKTLDRFIGKMT